MRADQGHWPIQASVELDWLVGDGTWSRRGLVGGREWKGGKWVIVGDACQVLQGPGE